MQTSRLTASLLALAFFMAPAHAFAGQAPAQNTMVVAQAQDSKRIDAVKKFIAAASRNLSRLSDDKLQQRLKRAQALQNTRNLPDDLMAGLKQAEQDLSAELAKRQQAGGSTTTGGKQAGQPAAGNDGGAQMPADVQNFLASAKSPADMNDRELRQQVRSAAQLSKTQGLSKDARQQLRTIIRDGRAEMQKRQQGGKANDQAAGGKQGGGTAQPGNSSSGDIAAFLQSVKPADQLNDAELRQQMRKAAELSRTQGISADDRRKLRQVVRDARAAMQNKGQGGTAATGGQTGTAADSPAGARSTEMMPEKKDPSKLSDAELRQRLQAMRDNLANGNLSPADKKALREQLAAERAVLRARVSQKNSTSTDQTTTIEGDNNTVNNTNVTVNNNTTINREVVRRVMADRRPSRDLKDDELRLRINAFSLVISDNRYSERERLEWRGRLERDRLLLRDRLLAARRHRQESLRVAVSSGKLNIRLGLRFQPDRPPPPRYVFAAEADTAELEDILAAPPRRAIDRRYSLDEVEQSPDLRDAVARIEIDTVHFGFGEGFLREEEIDKLDRIAEILERILAAHPNEVFMIEGHTDAVGSDEANLELSRERAQAVKEALITYYVIPPENLKTVGFGERYLKIPTEDAEPENRRVSLARITPLVGELEN